MTMTHLLAALIGFGIGYYKALSDAHRRDRGQRRGGRRETITAIGRL